MTDIEPVRCRDCHRPLTDPESIADEKGPDCSGRRRRAQNSRRARKRQRRRSRSRRASARKPGPGQLQFPANTKDPAVTSQPGPPDYTIDGGKAP